MSDLNFKWREDLDILKEKCPPVDAKHEANKIFYRLVKGDTVQKTDFDSQWKMGRKKMNDDISECQFRACSIFASKEECEETRKLYFKKYKIIAFKLDKTWGVVKKTPSQRNKEHYSWWISKNFDEQKLHPEEVI